MSVIRKDLGMVTAYAYAVSKGYTGTEEEFAELMASYADVAEEAAESATAAAGSATAAAASASAAQGYKTDAQTAATSAGTSASTATSKASEAANSATQAASSATSAAGSATTATTKATQAETAAGNSATNAIAAAQSASLANTKATDAATSATAAANSATQAAASASSAASAVDGFDDHVQDMIDTIPEDYTELTEDVNQLKADLTNVEQKVGGESGNLHDNSTDVIGKYWGENFTEETGSNYRHSVLIDIEAYDQIRITGSTSASGKYDYFVSEDQTQYSGFTMGSANGTRTRPSWAKYITLTTTKNNSSLCLYGIVNGTINTQISELTGEIPRIDELEDGYVLLSSMSNFQVGMYTKNDGNIHTSTTNACSSSDIVFETDVAIIADIGYVMDMKIKTGASGTYTLEERYSAFFIKAGQYVKVNIRTIPEATVTDASALAAHIRVYNLTTPTSPYTELRNSFYGIEMYNTVGFIGDSYTAKRSNYNNCWAELLCGKTGITGTIYAHSGYTTKQWLNNILATLEADTAKEFYWLALGINDASRVQTTPAYLGSEEDLSGSYEDYPDTFWGNYGHIIEAIQAHAPNCHMVICTIVYHDVYTSQINNGSTNIPVINTAIKGLAEHYSIPCIDLIDDIFYRSPDYQDNMQATAYTHPDPILFPGMANANMRLFSKAVADNPSYFRTTAT